MIYNPTSGQEIKKIEPVEVLDVLEVMGVNQLRPDHSSASAQKSKARQVQKQDLILIISGGGDGIIARCVTWRGEGMNAKLALVPTEIKSNDASSEDSHWGDQ